MCRGLGNGGCSCFRRKKSLWCCATLTLAVIGGVFYAVEPFREPAIVCTVLFSFICSVCILCCCLMKTNNRRQDVESNNVPTEYDDVTLKPPSYATVIQGDMNCSQVGNPAVHVPGPERVPLTLQCQSECVSNGVTTAKKSYDAGLPSYLEALSASNTGEII